MNACKKQRRNVKHGVKFILFYILRLGILLNFLKFFFRADGSCRDVAACLFDVQCIVHRNQQESCTTKECMWKKQGKPNENACPISDLKICKSEYVKRESSQTYKF